MSTTIHLERVCRFTSLRRHKLGVSLIEVVLVFAIVLLLISLVIPALSSSREAARSLNCKNNLREIGLATLSHESLQGKFVPANIGFRRVLLADTAFTNEWLEDSTSNFHWSKAPHTSSLVLLLPFLGEESAMSNAPTAFLSSRSYAEWDGEGWIGNLASISELSKMRIPVFKCPSDAAMPIGESMSFCVASQPVFRGDATSEQALDGFLTRYITSSSAESTNYIATSGAHSGGKVPIAHMAKYDGILGSHKSLRIAEVTDGLSNTMLYGESLGTINDGQRVGAYPWTFGALGRGRGGLPWGATSNPSQPEAYLFGDSTSANIAGFGSMHPLGVNIIRGDSSTQKISRDVSLSLWYSLNGAADGEVQYD